jgi:hypothetical protein
MRIRWALAVLWLAAPLGLAAEPPPATPVIPGVTGEWPAGTDAELLAEVRAGLRGVFFVEQIAADARLEVA